MGRPEEMRRRRRRRSLRRGGLVAAVAIVVGGGTWVVAAHQWGGPSSAAAAVRNGHGGGIGPSGKGVVPGGGGSPQGGGSSAATVATQTASATDSPAGMQSAAVVAENEKPGSSDWQIVGNPPGQIAGFADHTSAVLGDAVKLYVTTDAPTFTVGAYRMGYYGGAGARLVWTSPAITGSPQPPCPLDSSVNMVHCDNWTPTDSLDITSDFVPGDYLLKLVGSAGQESYVPLTVRDPFSRATYVLENDIYTWQAWNPWGGYDFYQGTGTCPPNVYPFCNRARVVSFDRPYGYGQGAADFLTNEYPLIRFVEQHGLDVTYMTSADFERYPHLMLQHRALMSLGHDECWSYHERLGAVAAEAKGVNLVFFGASPILRHVRLESSPLGALRQEVDYRESSADPLAGTGNPLEVTGNTWQVPPANWSEVPFVGANYTGYVEPGNTPVDLVVEDAGSWLYNGTGLSDGARLSGLLTSDFDQFQPGSSPTDVEIMGHSPMPRKEVQTSITNPASDITYYTDPQTQAGVFDTGTVAWIPDLQGSAPLQLMTANLLHLFGEGPAGRTEPSSPNWRTFYP